MTPQKPISLPPTLAFGLAQLVAENLPPHFRLPAHKPNRVGRRQTKKVFDQKGNRK